MGYSFRLTARVILCASSHRQDITYHGLCYTSRGALAGTRNSSMGPLHEGSIGRPIAPWANALTTELHLVPFTQLGTQVPLLYTTVMPEFGRTLGPLVSVSRMPMDLKDLSRNVLIDFFHKATSGYGRSAMGQRLSLLIYYKCHQITLLQTKIYYISITYLLSGLGLGFF